MTIQELIYGFVKRGYTVYRYRKGYGEMYHVGTRPGRCCWLIVNRSLKRIEPEWMVTRFDSTAKDAKAGPSVPAAMFVFPKDEVKK